MRLPVIAGLALALAGLDVTSAVAQQPPAGGVAAVRPLYDRLKGLFIKSVAQMPEDGFSFKPTPAVRSFGEQLAHVANENYLFCAAALGQENPNKTDFEKTPTKAVLGRAIAESFAYCDAVYRMDEAKALEETNFFGTKGTRLWIVIYNVTHDSEHYGSLVTYFRLKGMVPPSSQSGG